MRSKVQRWGNSLAVRIPKAFAAEAGLEADGDVDVTVREGSIVVLPLRPPRYDLEELLAAVRPDNLHDEVDLGRPAGAEAW